jgi:fibro-slime domain-containing protein
VPEYVDVDGAPLFFPIDDGPDLLDEPRSEGKIPDGFGWSAYPWETDVADYLDLSGLETAHADFPSTTHNFSFTSEVKLWFRYDAARELEIELAGDDDLWLFINGRLAIDLGSWHTPVGAWLTIGDGKVVVQEELDHNGTGVPRESSVEALGLEDGQIYPIAVFHAERQRETSAFKLAIGGTDLKRSLCVPEP